MSMFFSAEIHDWASWGNIFRSIEAWTPLIRNIFEKEKIPSGHIGNLTAGTNAVFKVDDYVVKIFAPKEAGFSGTDLQTEAAAMKHALSLGVSIPKLVTTGKIEDKYFFEYMIMEYINGRGFDEAAAKFSGEEKYAFGRRLRNTTGLLNKPCRQENMIDVIRNTENNRRWDKYSETFRRERLEHINKYNYTEKVFVHGDLCGDNILVANNGEITIIDFADAVMAPAVYEHALVASELFAFEKPFLHGYFGEYNPEELADLCFNGLLIHDFGGDIAEHRIAKAGEFKNLADLRDRIFTLLCG